MPVDAFQALADLATEGSHHHHHGPKPLPTIVPPLPVVQKAGAAGERTLWVVFVIMLLAMIAFSGMAFRVSIGKRLYHFVTTLIVTTAAISYFAMASGDGITTHTTHITEYHPKTGVTTHKDVIREVYWARYVDWAITTPLLLIDLGLLAGLTGGHLSIAIVADLIMILTGLFAALSGQSSAQKWGWYAIACIAYLVIVWQLVVNGRSAAMTKGGKVGGFYAAIGGFTLILWTIYPIVWGFADGARKVSVDGEIIAYAVLDVLAKPIFGLWLLLTHVNMPETNVDISGFWAHGLSSEGTIRVGDDDEGA